eukprot:CAMPEP_0195080104 /NCGR_PEP_ID=MMETSP0448-20130528/21890_1 /TAXON_ID=66468 /ORGANISM="Heterocapsa triquestra, Strain CCMP 448" /LENGTH=261 /DNA_ID=CAMNT_0040113015 /DNA_START=83 /DNA_END=869 /DNA_ORIENTATION=-
MTLASYAAGANVHRRRCLEQPLPAHNVTRQQYQGYSSSSPPLCKAVFDVNYPELCVVHLKLHLTAIPELDDVTDVQVQGHHLALGVGQARTHGGHVAQRGVSLGSAQREDEAAGRLLRLLAQADQHLARWHLDALERRLVAGVGEQHVLASHQDALLVSTKRDLLGAIFAIQHFHTSFSPHWRPTALVLIELTRPDSKDCALRGLVSLAWQHNAALRRLRGIPGFDQHVACQRLQLAFDLSTVYRRTPSECDVTGGSAHLW